jgi:hypothetical protein
MRGVEGSSEKNADDKKITKGLFSEPFSPPEWRDRLLEPYEQRRFWIKREAPRHFMLR